MTSCYDCIHCGACSDAGDSGFSCLKEDVSKCKHFKHKADVVEVVRCKDCIYSKEYNYLKSMGKCMCEKEYVRHGIYKKSIMLEVSKDDFCSFGAPKEEKRINNERKTD